MFESVIVLAHLHARFREVVKKNGLFTVRLTVRVYPPPSPHSEAILELFKIKSCPKIKRNASICIKIVLFTKIISFFGYVQNNFFPK